MELDHGNQRKIARLVHCRHVVVKTGEFYEQKMHKQGFAAYLGKPIHQIDLHNVLLQLAGLKDADVPDELITRYTTREQQPQFKAKVLVVDDNATNQAVAKGMLAKYRLKKDSLIFPLELSKVPSISLTTIFTFDKFMLFFKI